MSSSFQYNVLAGFRAVDAWQQTIVQNVQGLLTPGYNRQKLHIGQGGGVDDSGQNHAATQGRGWQPPLSSHQPGGSPQIRTSRGRRSDRCGRACRRAQD